MADPNGFGFAADDENGELLAAAVVCAVAPKVENEGFELPNRPCCVPPAWETDLPADWSTFERNDAPG